MTEQTPIFQDRFLPSSTTKDVIKGIDLSNKVVIVTGGYSGLGLETVKTLVNAGAQVIVPARDIEKATKNLEGINVEIESLDLFKPSTIDDFATKFLESNRPLHILINNAAVMACPYSTDDRNYERQFATNHLGHFQLTLRLWPALKQANGARVINVSSAGHRFSPVVFEDIHFQNRSYDPWLSYGQSKTANILFTKILDQKGKSDNIRSFSLHPGAIISTDLSRHISKETPLIKELVDENGNPIIDPLKQWKTIPQGASTTVWCATSQLLNNKGGVYCENNNISYIRDVTFPALSPDKKGYIGLSPHAFDQQSGEKLWFVSEQLTGIKF